LKKIGKRIKKKCVSCETRAGQTRPGGSSCSRAQKHRWCGSGPVKKRENKNGLRGQPEKTKNVFLVRYGRGRNDQEGVCVLGRKGANGAGQSLRGREI